MLIIYFGRGDPCHKKSGKWKFVRWWFQIFFIFTPMVRFPIWLICFRWVETTNQFSSGSPTKNVVILVVTCDLNGHPWEGETRIRQSYHVDLDGCFFCRVKFSCFVAMGFITMNCSPPFKDPIWKNMVWNLELVPLFSSFNPRCSMTQCRLISGSPKNARKISPSFSQIQAQL